MFRKKASTSVERPKPLIDLNFAVPVVFTPAICLIMSLGGWATHIGVAFIFYDAVTDYLAGEDHRNYPAAMEKHVGELRFYRVLNYLAFVGVIVLVIYSMYLFTRPDTTMFEQIGVLLSCSIGTAALGIIRAHELIHRPSRFDRGLGGILLAFLWYGTFKVEHVRGHHKSVATDDDPSSARRGQNVYGFICKAVVMNFIKAFHLESTRLRQRGHSTLSIHNEALLLTALSILFTFGMWMWAGTAGAKFFVLQGIVAILLLEVINYVQHYGLRRTRLDSCVYEKPNYTHSWNSSARINNFAFVNLLRHSDHHVNQARPYQLLRDIPEAPQLPMGYTGAIILAAMPPLWFRVIHPILDQYEDRRREPLRSPAVD